MLILVPLLAVLAAHRPPPARPARVDDTTSVARFAAVAAGARAALAADAGRLWGARLDRVEWMAVVPAASGGDGAARVYLTASPSGVAGGYEPVVTSDDARIALWSGAMPAGIAPANTSVEWGGRTWAMVMLPLPADSMAAVRLLVHEAMHTLQGHGGPLPAIASGEGGAGAALLDRPEGRIWLQLEERALGAALGATGEAQGRALGDALVFRARRYAAATPAERARERALDVSEGLPEYTAWALTAGTGRRGARAFAPSLAAAGAKASYVRSFPYATGPAYAFVVDQRLTGWSRHVMSHGAAAFDLQRLALSTVAGAPAWLGAALGDTTAAAPSVSASLARAADAAGARYGLAALRAAEDARWAAREQELARLRQRFVSGPTLRVRPGTLRFSFDPGGQTPLGDAGTVMRGLVWKGDGGASLEAPEGALVTADWSELRVPLDTAAAAALAAGPTVATRTWSGAGWTLTLPAGWKLAAQSGGGWVAEPEAR